MTSLLLYVFFTILVIKLVKWLFSYINLLNKINKIDSLFISKGMIPFIGNAHQLESGSSFYKLIEREAKKSKDKSVLRFWIGTQPIVLFTKAESVEFLVNSSKHIDKSPEYRFLHPWLGTGLLTRQVVMILLL